MLMNSFSPTSMLMNLLTLFRGQKENVGRRGGGRRASLSILPPHVRDGFIIILHYYYAALFSIHRLALAFKRLLQAPPPISATGANIHEIDVLHEAVSTVYRGGGIGCFRYIQ